jgi:PAS domain S-box-containing protein
VSAPDQLLAEDLFESAPCGYLVTALDGTILRVNRTFEEMTGLDRAALVGSSRFQDLLSPGGRIYHETHYAPLLRMQGWVRAIAVELVRADGSRLPALVNSSVLSGDTSVVRTAVFDATDRRRYEEELLRSRDREQEVALALQRSLLDDALVSSPGVALGVAYRPAEKGLEVGGDWYDAFWLEPEERIGIVIGDVVGRGLEAAATMGQLRSAVRALASVGFDPGALLEALSEFSRRHGVGQMATVAYCEVDVRLGTMRYACAGHPPPVVVAPDEDARCLWEGRSAPLDAHTAWSDRPEAEFPLPPGSMVVLYTDGLIERHDRPLMAGLDALVGAVERVRDAAPREVADALAREATEGAARADDVCVLAMRLAQP